MSDEHPGYLDVPDWWQHQHYRDPVPPWIKLETRLIISERTRKLSLSERGLLVSVWAALAASRFAITADLTELRRIIGAQVRPEALKALCDAGLLAIVPERPDIDARRPSRARARALAEERELRSLKESESEALDLGDAAASPARNGDGVVAQDQERPDEDGPGIEIAGYAEGGSELLTPDPEGLAKIGQIMRDASARASEQRTKKTPDDGGLLDDLEEEQ